MAPENSNLGSEAAHPAAPQLPVRRSPLHWFFRQFCRLVVRVHYRRCEVMGLKNLPRRGPVLVCANHPNALVDAVILQALLPRSLHPLARSGLFRNPLLRPMLAAIGAVPVRRRQDSGSDSVNNEDAFSRCYDLLKRGGTLLIFPEGESHSDSHMRGFRTGAARIVLGAQARDGTHTAVVPVGLSFSRVGRFRGTVFVNVAPPIYPPEAPPSGESHTSAPGEGEVQALTRIIQAGLETVTLNPGSWRELELARQIERFFALRRGRIRKGNLSQRFRALKKLIDTLHRLLDAEPERVERIRRRLSRFERLCRRAGVRDYHLSITYSPALVSRYIARTLGVLLCLLPLGAWGYLWGVVPYRLTGFLAKRLARGRYQTETAQISLGMGFFGLFWGVQTYVAYQLAGPWWAAAYLLSLPVGGAAALIVARERERIVDNVRGFLVFFNKRDLRTLLTRRRRELELDLARLTQAAKRIH